jgi:hypothetical protein
VGKGRALPEVVLAEDHHPPHGLADFARAVVGDEVASHQIGREVCQRRGRVNAPAGEGDRFLVEIGGEDAHAQLLGLGAEEVGQHDRQRVGFFPRRAAGGPEPQLARG